MSTVATVHVLHENPDWFPLFAEAFAAEGVPLQKHLLAGGVLDLSAPPAPGVPGAVRHQARAGRQGPGRRSLRQPRRAGRHRGRGRAGGTRRRRLAVAGVSKTRRRLHHPVRVRREQIFSLREGFVPPVLGAYAEFLRRWHIEIAGVELIETAEGRVVTYDVNTNTNDNAAVDAVAPRSGPREIARFLGRLLAAGRG